MKKKKVFIHIHQGILKGGVEKVFHTLLNNLPINEYDITVLSVMGYLTDDFDAHLYPKDVKRYCLMWDEFSKKSLARRVIQKIHNRIFPWYYRHVLKFKKYDIAIAAQEGSYARFIIDHVKANKKFLWIHNDIMQCHWTVNQFENIATEEACYQKFDKIICVSNMVAQSMKKLFANLQNICVCYNPIDTKAIDNKLKAPEPEHPECTWFICIGRLAYQKGFDRLINVCNKLTKESYKFKVSILGEGEERLTLKKMINDLNLPNIELLGNQSNPFIYIKSADWFLQTSRHEGFGLALYESAYCGTPVISTDVAGAKELLGDSKYGIITENNEKGIYTAMKQVLDNPDIRIQYKSAIGERTHIVNLEERINEILQVINE